MTMAGRLQGLKSSSPGVTKSARTPRVNYRSASVRIQGTFSEPVPLNATDTYPAGYPSSKHIADERYTGKQMNGLMGNALPKPLYPGEENPRTLRLTGCSDYFPYKANEYVEQWRIDRSAREHGKQIMTKIGIVPGFLVHPQAENERAKNHLGLFTCLPPNCIGDPLPNKAALPGRHRGIQMGVRSTGGRGRTDYRLLPHLHLSA